MTSSALQRCVGDVGAFRAEGWGRRSLLVPPAAPDSGAAFADLLTLDDVDLLIAGTSLRVPLFRLVKAGKPLPTSSYTTQATIGGVRMDGIADAARVYAAMNDGATLVLQGLQRYWPPLAGFVRELELDLGHPCQVNAYITPAGSQGLGVHSDEHDVFVLQAFGSKKWEVHAAPAERQIKGAAEPRELTLEPGAALYLPKGTPHAARAQEELSGHLTIGVPATTWRVAVDAAVRRVADEAGLDERLPLAYYLDRPKFSREVADRLREVARRLEKLDSAEVADELVDRFLTTRPRPLIGGLQDRVALGGLTIESRLQRRGGALAVLRPAVDGRVRLLIGDRELRLPSRAEPALRVVAERQELAVSDLTGVLDAEGALVLTRRLVREGLLEVCR